MFGKSPKGWLRKKGTILNYTSKLMKSQVFSEKKLKIEENVPLAPFTTFKIGGPARYLVRVSAEDELLEAVDFAQEKNLEIFVLAGGSNVLISDEGFSGLVIKLEFSSYQLRDGKVECGAGCSLAQIVNLARDNSLSGLEWASGIPGSIGGAVRGNAGAYGGEMADSLESVRYLEVQNEKLGLSVLIGKECNFAYRSSIFKEKRNWIIFSAILNLKPGDKKEIEFKMKDFLSKREEKLPCDPSAGSFFQNPLVNDPELIAKFEKDAGCECRGGKIPAGWIVDELGLRGRKMGGVAVSEKHANFVVNLGKGKAQDVIMLASFIKQQARTKLGVQLHEEVQYVGF
jgi:UDP-N-acetylmuramate dehydrogenase